MTAHAAFPAEDLFTARQHVDALSAHSVLTVQGLEWAGIKNGDLLKGASGRIDAFVTMDRSLEREHDLSVLSFGVLIVRARSNRIPDLLPLVPEMVAALDRLGPGRVEHVGSAGGPSHELTGERTASR